MDFMKHINLFVNNVLKNVLPAQTLINSVKRVLILEKIPQYVVVQKDILKTQTKIVNNVVQHASIVIFKVVLHVLAIELDQSMEYAIVLVLQ
jgi:hypothetical protein